MSGCGGAVGSRLLAACPSRASASFGTGNPALPNQSIAETMAVRGRPGLPYKFPISMYLAAETRLWQDLGWQTIFSAETTFCRTNHPQTNFSPAERHLTGPNTNPSRRPVRETPALPNQIHRGDHGGTGNPGFAVPDFYPAGLSRAGRLGTEKHGFSVPSLLYRCRASGSSATVRRLSPSVCALRRHSAGQTA